MGEELGDPCGQVAVDAVHVAGSGHDGAHVFVAVLDALLHLNEDKDIHAPAKTFSWMININKSTKCILSFLTATFTDLMTPPTLTSTFGKDV